MNVKKKKKISAIENLRIKKARLKAEEQSHIQALDKNISYLQRNIGILLIDAGWTVVKAQFPRNNFAAQIVDIAPVVFKELKPIIISFVLRKIKNLIFK